MKNAGARLVTAVFIIAIFAQGIFYFFNTSPVKSDNENRMLAEPPPFSLSGFFAGEFAGKFEAFTNDRIALRDEYLRASKRVGAVYNTTIFQSDDDIIVLDAQTGGEEPTPPPTKKPEVTPSVPPSGKPSGEPEAAPEEQTPPPAPDEPFEQQGSILMAHGRLFEEYRYSASKTAAYTDAVNKLYEACGEPETYVIMPPTAAMLYIPENKKDMALDQKNSLDYVRDNLNGPVFLDLRDSFSEHKEEDIYFKCDHHWTGLGAYYAYSEYIKALGMTPTALAEYESGTRLGFRGSLYKAILRFPQSDYFEENPDEVRYYFPLNAPEATKFETFALKNGINIPVINPYYDDDSNLYCIFMQDAPLLYMHSPIGNGKSVMVVRDSYGHAFLPFLADNFEHIYAVEPRYFNKDKQDFVLSDFYEKHEIDTLLFLNYALPSTADYWTGWAEYLEKLL